MKKDRHDRQRQRRATHKARKALGRAVAAAQFQLHVARLWANSKEVSK